MYILLLLRCIGPKVDCMLDTSFAVWRWKLKANNVLTVRNPKQCVPYSLPDLFMNVITAGRARIMGRPVSDENFTDMLGFDLILIKERRSPDPLIHMYKFYKIYIIEIFLRIKNIW